MKKIFILAFASIIGGSAFAQTKTTGGMSYGLKAGINLPKYQFQNQGGVDPETATTTNFHVTGYLDAPLSSMFSVQPGISLQGKGGKFYENKLNGVNKVQDEQNTLWVEVPVNLVGHFPISGGTNFYLGAGPYAAIAVSGQRKKTVGTTETKTDLNFGKSTTDDLKKADLGLNFLAGIQLVNNFNVGAGYGLGLTDLRPTQTGGQGKQTHRVLSFSVGYAF